MAARHAFNKKRGFDRKRSKGIGIKPFLTFALSIVLAFLLVSISYDSVVAVSGPTTEENVDFNVSELYGTQNSGRVVRELNIATAAGVGRITEDTPQGRLLGRRAALTDARRNLLVLRQELLRQGQRHSVSGRIAGVRIHSERVVNDLYFLQVDIPLDELMEGVIGIE